MRSLLCHLRNTQSRSRDFERERERQRERERKRERQRERQRETERDRERQRETERQRDRETERNDKSINYYRHYCPSTMKKIISCFSSHFAIPGDTQSVFT